MGRIIIGLALNYKRYLLFRWPTPLLLDDYLFCRRHYRSDFNIVLLFNLSFVASRSV